MKRPIVLGAILLGVAVLTGLGGAYVYFFSGLRTAPRPLALSTATPAAGSSPAAAPATAAGLVGSWTVAQGSQAEYRVKEQFAGTSSAHEAVARTSSVSGGLTVQQGSTGLQASAITFSAQLSSLQSVDQVAGYNVSQRDRIVSQSLSVFQYPDATFQSSQVIDLPASIVSGATESMTVPGQLTVHGVTKPVQVSVQLRLDGGRADAAGSTSFKMTDFGVEPPRVPITSVDPGVTVGFQLVLTRT
jgi:polyisoprenoid-binding protein YceI